MRPQGRAPDWFPADSAIVAMLSRHEPIYRWRRPRYLLQLLRDLAALLPEGDCRVLDLGGGSGLVGAAIATFFPGKRVTALDVVDRFLPGLPIASAAFDGRTIPFAEGSFDCALFCNVLHHVPPPARAGLLAEALRVTGGRCIVIKDHVAASAIDRARLAWLDFVGNLPFGGMVRAQYLAAADWNELFAAAGCRVQARIAGTPYRSAAGSMVFPNRLEVLFRLRA